MNKPSKASIKHAKYLKNKEIQKHINKEKKKLGLRIGITKRNTPKWECRLGFDYVPTKSGSTIFKRKILKGEQARRPGRIGKKAKVKNTISGHNNQIGKLKKEAYKERKRINERVNEDLEQHMTRKQLNDPQNIMNQIRNKHNEDIKKLGIKPMDKF